MIKYPYDGEVLGAPFDPKLELLRLNLGYSLRYAKKIDLAKMTLRNDIALTQYCLANQVLNPQFRVMKEHFLCLIPTLL